MPPRRIRPNPQKCIEARVLRGFKLRESALKLGISHAHLSNIEAGKVGASEKVLRLMADLYGVPMTSLFTFVEDAA